MLSQLGLLALALALGSLQLAAFRMGTGRAAAIRSSSRQSLQASIRAAAMPPAARKANGDHLLPYPPPNSLGSFFVNTTEHDKMSFIVCYMYALASIGGEQYGVGFPTDMPVMLGYFQDGELLAVKEEDYEHYDHLLDHVGNQLDDQGLQLYRTPMVLTLQGDFQDESFNRIYGCGDKEEDEEGDGDGDGPSSLQELLDREDYFGTSSGVEDDEEEEEEEEGSDQYEDNEEVGAEEAGDYSTYTPEEVTGEGADLSDIPADAFVSEDDSRALRRAHRKADRILAHASDVKLMASFLYCKRTFHLVRLMEPIFIIGQRMAEAKGYFFKLLDDGIAQQVRPQLEDLLLADQQPAHLLGREEGGEEEEEEVRAAAPPRQRTSSPKAKETAAPPRARRGWLKKQQQQLEEEQQP